MKATVHVTLKNGVLDPQGQAIHHAAETLGYSTLAGIRQGKFFEIEIAEGADLAAAKAEVEKLAHDVLSNIVIEDYCVTIEKSRSAGGDDEEHSGGHA
ncbi:MAG: phosphoribosylformylglycinamidine synthase subunit PurS [Blastocatellia bacterium]|nr:phosphoribosylformylglycinamidine synthase subunit PurS [Blastocatellia bacterium]